MSMAVLFAALATTLWAAVGGTNELATLGPLFFLTVASSWAVLVPGKFFTERRGDVWTRRMVMMVLGGLIGVLALWLNGWSAAVAMVDKTGDQLPNYGMSLMRATGINEAGYIS